MKPVTGELKAPHHSKIRASQSALVNFDTRSSPNVESSIALAPTHVSATPLGSTARSDSPRQDTMMPDNASTTPTQWSIHPISGPSVHNALTAAPMIQQTTQGDEDQTSGNFASTHNNSAASPKEIGAGSPNGDDRRVDMFDTLVNSIENSLDIADDKITRLKHMSSSHQTIGTENTRRPTNENGEDLKNNEVHVTGTKPADKRGTNNGSFRLPTNLLSGGRQNNFPVKFKLGRHIYYRISDQQFVILVCPVPRCRQTTFGRISDIIDHLANDHFTYQNDVFIRNYEDALDAFGKVVGFIEEERKVKVEVDENENPIFENTSRALAILPSGVDDQRTAIGFDRRAPALPSSVGDSHRAAFEDYRRIPADLDHRATGHRVAAILGEAPQLHRSIEDSTESGTKGKSRKRHRIDEGVGEPTTTKKRRQFSPYHTPTPFER